MPESFTILDAFLIVLVLLIGWFLVDYFEKKRRESVPVLKWLFVVKLLGLGAFLLFNFFYKNSGDTFMYYRGGEMLSNHFYESPKKYFSLVFSNHQELRPLLQGVCSVCGFREDNSSILMIKIVSIFNLLFFNSFWAISLVFTFLSLVGQWLMFVAFEKILGKLSLLTSFLVLFLPSFLFWSSGIMKESLSVLCLGVLLYTFFVKFKSQFVQYFLLILFSILLWGLKNYVFYVFLASIFFYLLILNYKKEAGRRFKFLFYGIVAVFVLIVGVEVYTGFELSKKALFRLKDYQTFHSMRTDSGYTFGKTNYDVVHLIVSAPKAILTTLFRPFLWELSNLKLLIPSLESFLAFIGITFVVSNYNKLKKIKFNISFMVFCGTFIVVLSFIVGMSSYSFGALSRYRILMLPFLLLMVGYSIQKIRELD